MPNQSGLDWYNRENEMDRNELQQQALANATQNASLANYAAIYAGFEAKGIAQSAIEPRVNVFTFNAWKALGRVVRKGEHGVKVCTWVAMTKQDANGEAQDIGRKPRITTVFHISQTDPLDTTQQQSTPAVRATPTPRPQVAQDYYSTEFTPI